MFTWIIVALTVYGAFSYRKALLLTANIMWRMSAYSKFVLVVFILGIMPLIWPERVPGHFLPLAWPYALGVLGLQLWRIYRAGRRIGHFLPRPCRLLVPCILLVMATPLWDLFLGRRYPDQAAALVGAVTLSYVCLYLIEVYIRYPHLERESAKEMKRAVDTSS